MEESKLEYMPADIPKEQLIPWLRSCRTFYVKERGVVMRALDNYAKVWLNTQGKVHSERFGKLGSMKMLNLSRTPESVASFLKLASKLGSVVLIEKMNENGSSI
jgi:hypothetical protein